MGVAPFSAWVKVSPPSGSYDYSDAFRLPALPKPILFALRGKLNWLTTARQRPLPALGVSIAGVSRDSLGAALGGCTCTLFRVANTLNPLTGTNNVTYTQVAQTVSDGSGNYSFVVGFDGPYRVTFDLAGTPTVAGLTVNTLSGS